MHEQESKWEIPASVTELAGILNQTMKKIQTFLIAAVVGAIAINCAAQTELSVTDAGAVGNGATLNTKNIQAAIDQLAKKGGGTLIVPKGVFLTGAIFLKPGVNLHLDEGAVLKGSTNVLDYPKMMTRIEGHFQMGAGAGERRQLQWLAHHRFGHT
jgi:polygalacturonase